MQLPKRGLAEIGKRVFTSPQHAEKVREFPFSEHEGFGKANHGLKRITALQRGKHEHAPNVSVTVFERVRELEGGRAKRPIPSQRRRASAAIEVKPGEAEVADAIKGPGRRGEKACSSPRAKTVCLGAFQQCKQFRRP
ncbi:MAG: hypothetical protein Q3963_03545 [Coriobacteriaceae bacterium]|nr:hypothetical protein [Coriobacteriaceae bacterium]